MSRPRIRTPRSRPAIQTENEVEFDFISFLVSEGWTPTRQHSGVFLTQYGVRIRIGTPGMCDWRFDRPARADGRMIVDLLTGNSISVPALVQSFELEAKRPGETPEKKQMEYMAKRTHLGYLAVWFDSLVAFKTWYYATFREARAA